MRNNLLLYVVCALMFFCWSCEDQNGDNLSVGQTGQGGSLARFAVSGNHLYVVGESSLINYDISDPSKLQFVNDIPIEVDIETIFPRGEHLYIGAESGMHIFDISQPDQPRKLSTYEHITSCDPVVVRNNFAYVSLRAGCGANGANTFEVIDITDPKQPVFMSRFNHLVSPYGLGVAGDYVYLCEGDNGLKVLNVSDPYEVVLEDNIDIKAYDVIVIDEKRLILTGNDGIYQYDIKGPSDLQLLSFIPVIK